MLSLSSTVLLYLLSSALVECLQFWKLSQGADVDIALRFHEENGLQVGLPEVKCSFFGWSSSIEPFSLLFFTVTYQPPPTINVDPDGNPGL